MSKQERWEEIAEELGSYDMENTSYGFDPCYEMVKQEKEYYGYAPGAYVETEAACRRIEELEAENDRMECLLRQCEIFLAIHANPENTLLRDIRETLPEPRQLPESPTPKQEP